MLEVGDGQRVYWEASGNPHGRPALVVHGGPGSGSTPGRRRLFDPAAYLIVQFDQRGCGSTWAWSGGCCGAGPGGGPWGLAFAERHPERVRALVLASVTMTRPADIHWLYHEVGRYFPEQWERFRNGVPEGERDGDLVAAYHRLLHQSPDPAVRVRAARDWCRWEDELLSNEPGWQPNPRYEDPVFRMAFARIVIHYFHHRAWL